MKITILLCFLWFLNSLAATEQLDPFGSANPQWYDAIQETKPLQLELIFGESTEDYSGLLSHRDGIQSHGVGIHITNPDEVLSAFNQIKVAVAKDDTGSVVFKTTSGSTQLSYRLESNGQKLSLNIALRSTDRLLSGTATPLSSTTALSTLIHLELSDQWTSLGGLSRETIQTTAGPQPGNTEERFILLAVRITEKSRASRSND